MTASMRAQAAPPWEGVVRVAAAGAVSAAAAGACGQARSVMQLACLRPAASIPRALRCVHPTWERGVAGAPGAAAEVGSALAAAAAGGVAAEIALQSVRAWGRGARWGGVGKGLACHSEHSNSLRLTCRLKEPVALDCVLQAGRRGSGQAEGQAAVSEQSSEGSCAACASAWRP